MATTVFPETADAVTEAAWTSLGNSTSAVGRVVDGYQLTGGGGLNVAVAAGTAFIKGYNITSDGSQTKGLAASDTNYVWLEKDGDVIVNITGTASSTDALLLGTVMTDGSGVTSLRHDIDSAIQEGFVYIRKAFDEALFSSSAQQDDNELLFTAEARSKWRVEIFAICTADATGGMASSLQIPSGGGVVRNVADPTASVVRIEAFIYNHSAPVNSTVTGVSSITPMNKIEAVITIGQLGGSVKYRWAQNITDGADTVIKAGSVLIATRIPT